MTPSLQGVLIALLILSILSQKSATGKQWCIADKQIPDEDLQKGLDWACGAGGANCIPLQPDHPCFYPNTVADHASYAFNTYYQNHKHQVDACFFGSLAYHTQQDPSYGSCIYDYTPE